MLQNLKVDSPWHPGEVALQASLGVAERLAEVGRHVIRDHLIEQHQLFYPLLPMAVLASVDAAGDAWATVRTGYPGFMQAIDDRYLHLDLKRDPRDPADAGMDDGRAIGMLGIDLGTRRRNRLNGEVVHSDTGLSVRVEQSFGNCPKYIQLRGAYYASDPTLPSEVIPEMADSMGEDARSLVRRADTFFVASYADLADGRRQVDVSHRGGPPGFVRIDGDVLVIPDYAGNLFFNTLGNIAVNPRVGLTFVDFESGGLLQLSGDAFIMDPVETALLPGAERMWRFTPRKVVWRPGVLALRWDFREWSPSLAKIVG
ncbi:pyridoxamine 5'-phosphate oxidase family protein [Rhizobium sp. TH2]|uniref:pyridoxamine 5'-phosphate oxidase family protein n=1 Tax=Rhizobium sp. TH2 TaxID=2775403 RepID=UPI002158195C|nr:pyridoxamine 5'-phosphate oxidase family protein [Rhizobium sp. TH2]UVC11029.1 pyridoxamine 5'-phosphate oxidase family protein [Rhizobium sp. TH2]